MKKYVAEFVGTLLLVLMGCGAVVIAGSQLGFVGIALAFGLTLMALCYWLGPISGCHVNPAVSFGFFTAGRLSGRDLAGYIIAQLLGAIAGAALLYLIIMSKLGGYDIAVGGLGQNGWGIGYQGEFGIRAAVLFELVASFVFVSVILAVTRKRISTPTAVAGLIIGLTLGVVHLVGLNITGTSVNPARSLGPALIVGGQAIEQLWVFLLWPMVGGLLGGLADRLIEQGMQEELEEGLGEAPRFTPRHP